MIPEIKICGLTTVQDAELMNKYQADYAGLVLFFEKSKRYNTLENAWKILAHLDKRIQPVAVTVSPTIDQLQMIEKMGFAVLQVHGGLCEEVLECCSIPIWRAYNISGAEAKQQPEVHEKITGYVLDGQNPGEGKPFDWKQMQAFDPQGRKLILAGGLTADNVADAVQILKPDIVDVSSGVEPDADTGGQLCGKDEKRVRKFIERVRNKK